MFCNLYLCVLVMLTVCSSIDRTLRFEACMTLFVPLSFPSLYVKGFVVRAAIIHILSTGSPNVGFRTDICF